MKRSFDSEMHQKVNRLIRKSVEYAFAKPESSMPYVKQHAQEMSEEVMKKHIALYVNQFSIDLGETGKKAVELMLEKANQFKLLPTYSEQIVLQET